MDPIRIQFPVTLPDGTMLLPAGTALTPRVLSDLARGPGGPVPARPLMAHGTVSDDIRGFCARSPYDRIFSDDEEAADVFVRMEGVFLAEPLLGFLDYFKTFDPYTYRHILVVFALSLLLAGDLIDDPDRLAREAAAAPCHDFGKVSVPLEILTKATALTPLEKARIAHHAAAGYAIMCHYVMDPEHPAAVTARDHHERLDGSGYPAGRRLHNPMVEIVAVCDVFDALIAERPYRSSSFDLRTALEEITRLARDGRFHWEVVQALIACNRRERPHYSRCSVSEELRGRPPGDNRYSGIPGR